MDIQKRLPFHFCDRCDEFILKVEEQVIFGEDHKIENVLIVRCKNEPLCKRLKEALKNET